jgi:SAM-dependent methyltransferase
MITSQKQIYDKWNYGEYSNYKKNLILNELSLNTKRIFLDVACGSGDFSSFIPKNYKYIGLEFSSVQIQKAKKLNRNVKYADLRKKFPISNNSVDVILASEILEHLFDTDFFLSECHRVLKKNGTLIITTPNICDLSGRIRCIFGRRPPNIEHRAGRGYAGHIRAFTIHDLRELLKENKLILKKYTGYEFYLPFKITCDTKYLGYMSKIFSKLIPTLSTGLLIVCKK